MLQQGQVEAISTDDVVLKGLAHQDPNVEVVGESIAIEPYGIGVKLENTDLVRFVNGVLERIRDDGTWQGLYENRLQELGPSPGPRHHATRTDHEGADHRRDRSRTRVADKGSRCDVGDADRAGEPPRTRARASLSTDRRDSATMVGDREVPRAAVGGLGADDVHSGLGTHGAGARSKPDDDDRSELTKLLRERPLEVSRQPIPLAKRQIGGLGVAVEDLGLADTAERMNAAYPAVVELLDAVDRINSLVAEKLGPSEETTRRVRHGSTAGDRRAVADIRDRSTLLTTRDIEERITAIADSVEQRTAELAELAAIQSIGPTPWRRRPSSWTSCGTRARVRRRFARAPYRKC